MSDPLPTGPITADLDGLRRLERRLVRATTWRAAGRRWLESVPAILQITVAAVASFAVARYLIGHENPILAVTVTITSLGFNRDARPVRVLQSLVAILFGVLLATGVVALAGQGIWQLAIVLVVVFSVARLLVPSAVFATAAATPASLTAILPVPEGGPFLRVEDAAIAAVMAVLVTILIPRSTRRIAEREGRAVFSLVVQATGGIADALREGNGGAAELALDRLRRAQPLVDAWTDSLGTARAVARISPWLRPRLPELDRAQRALLGCDAAIRHLRLIARRAQSVARAGDLHDGVAGLIADVARAVGLLGAEQEDLELAGAARSVLVDIGARLDPAVLAGGPVGGSGASVADSSAPGSGGSAVGGEGAPVSGGSVMGGESAPIASGSVAESALVLQLRPLVVDLLVATGLPLPDAQGRLVAL